MAGSINGDAAPAPPANADTAENSGTSRRKGKRSTGGAWSARDAVEILESTLLNVNGAGLPVSIVRAKKAGQLLVVIAGIGKCTQCGHLWLNEDLADTGKCVQCTTASIGNG